MYDTIRIVSAWEGLLMNDKAANMKSEHWVRRYMKDVSYYCNELSFKEYIIPFIARSLEKYNLVDAGDDLGEAIFGRVRKGYYFERNHDSSVQDDTERFKRLFVQTIDDALHIYAKTGSLWYAEFVANALSVSIRTAGQYDKLIRPVINDVDLADKMFPYEFDITTNSNKGGRYTRYAITLESSSVDKQWYIRQFYANILRFTDNPKQYFKILGFKRTASIVNIISHFPLRQYGLTKRGIMDTVIEAYHENEETYEWLSSLLAEIVRKPIPLPSGVSIDIDWVHQHQQYPIDFLRESISIIDGAISNMDYDARGNALLKKIDGAITGTIDNNNDHDMVSKDRIVNYVSQMLGINVRRKFSSKQKSAFYDIMLMMMDIPDEIWNIIEFSENPHNVWDEEYYPMIPVDVFSYRYKYKDKTTRIMTYLLKLMQEKNVDMLYRQAMLSNMQNTFSRRTVYRSNTYMKRVPKAIMDYVRYGTVSESISYDYDNGTYAIVPFAIIMDKNTSSDKSTTRIMRKTFMSDFDMIGLMKSLPKTYDDFLRESKKNGITGRELYASHAKDYIQQK